MAAVIIEAVLLLLLFAAGAGLLRRVRELELTTYKGVGVNLAASSTLPISLTRPTMVIKLTQRCSVCDDIVHAVDSLAAELSETTDLMLVVDRPDFKPVLATRVKIVADPAIWRTLPVPYVPALLVVDSAGTIINTHPIGSVERLRELIHAKEEVK